MNINIIPKSSLVHIKWMFLQRIQILKIASPFSPPHRSLKIHVRTDLKTKNQIHAYMIFQI